MEINLRMFLNLTIMNIREFAATARAVLFGAIYKCWMSRQYPQSYKNESDARIQIEKIMLIMILRLWQGESSTVAAQAWIRYRHHYVDWPQTAVTPPPRPYGLRRSDPRHLPPLRRMVQQLAQTTQLPARCFQVLQLDPAGGGSEAEAGGGVVVVMNLTVRALPRATLSNFTELIATSLQSRSLGELLGSDFRSTWLVQVGEGNS